MTSELSNFAARLRERILSEGRVTRGLDREVRNGDGDSSNSSLRSHEAFNSLALELFALQFTHNSAYRTICEARGATPSSVSCWSQIPAVPTAAFKELELTCLAPAQRTQVFHSSGTTEQRPSRHFHNAESLTVYEASLWSWFLQNGLTDLRLAVYPSSVADLATVLRSRATAEGERPAWKGGLLRRADDLRLAILTPPPVQAPHSSLVHMFDTVRLRLGAPESAFVGRPTADGSWTLDFDATRALLATDSRLQTSDSRLVLLGTAFSLVHLLDFLAEQDLRFQLPPGSTALETGGYKGRSRNMPKAELHRLITERLGVPPWHIVCEYGMSELSSQAYDKVTSDRWRVTQNPERHSSHLSPITRHFQFPPWTRTQIISPETGGEVREGETGLIRVFDLANVFSVMAIQTEDLGVRREAGFELIGRTPLGEPRGCSLMSATPVA